MYKTIINAKIVTPGEIIEGSINIDGSGKIVEVGSDISSSENVYDAKGQYVLPGLIEVHGHMREPGLTTKEDVPHGTKAAVAGGFTTIIDMPNTKPPTTTVELLSEKINKIYPGRSYTDYAFFLGVGKDSLGELEKVDPETIAGIKVFMAGHETTPTTIPDDKTLSRIFEICAEKNMLVAVHAEDQWLINYYTDKLKSEGRTDARAWTEGRPNEVIVTGAGRAIVLAEIFKTRLYLLHLSTPEEFALVKAASDRGNKIYGELVSYQMVFNTDDYETLGNKIKVSPALRSKENQEELWKLIKERKIDVMCSEHTPHEWETKNQPDVWKAQSGTPGIQETLPGLITKWIEKYGKENIEEFLKLISGYCSKNPAVIFGFSGKGEIKAGNDADLVVIDTENEWIVSKEDLFTKCGWSAYEGMKLSGRPEATFLRGELVYEKGKIKGDPKGKWVRKEKANE